jgi:hypothetical protein
LYPCRALESKSTVFFFNPVKQFNPEDFSGGPIVNSNGEVVGILQAGNKSSLMGTPVEAIRKKLKEEGFEIE